VQSALGIQSTFLDTLRSTTAGHLPYSALELRPAETTTSASQLEVHLQDVPVEQFPENHNIIDQAACQQIGAHDNVLDNSSPNAEVELIPMFTDSMGTSCVQS
jgi:hypothetical protein